MVFRRQKPQDLIAFIHALQTAVLTLISYEYVDISKEISIKTSNKSLISEESRAIPSLAEFIHF